MRRRFPTLSHHVDQIIDLVWEQHDFYQRCYHRRPQIVERAGVTLLQKSHPFASTGRSKIALVLAGGGVAGGCFKLGGLCALDDFLSGRKITDFDVYVGSSAGAFLAAPLAAGVSPAEILHEQRNSDSLHLFDFYYPNFREWVGKPPRYLLDMLRWAGDLLVRGPSFLRGNTKESLSGVGEAPFSFAGLTYPFPYTPSGLFDNTAIERCVRQNLEQRHLTNDFFQLYHLRHRQLYIVATKLDTAERVIFGPDENSRLTIAQAVQASTALPGFYKPARIHGVDYVDGGVVSTANIDVAINHGADLVICFNPLRPLTHQPDNPHEQNHLAEQGAWTVLNQVLRAILHSRLRLELQHHLHDRDFHGDIIVIEPTENDRKFFHMTPLAFWQRHQGAHHGYLSVASTLANEYTILRPICESHGLPLKKKSLPMAEWQFS